MEGIEMKTVMLGVASRESLSRRFVQAMETGKPQGNFITFESAGRMKGCT